MSKPKTKQELIQLISRADILQFDVDIINRKDSASVKKSKEAGFIKQISSSVKSERDIIVVSIKVR